MEMSEKTRSEQPPTPHPTAVPVLKLLGAAGSVMAPISSDLLFDIFFKAKGSTCIKILNIFILENNENLPGWQHVYGLCPNHEECNGIFLYAES